MSRQVDDQLRGRELDFTVTLLGAEDSVALRLDVPFVRMGAITSHDLFGLDELILFSFYFKNRSRYSRVVDLGANIGVHSAVLSMLGYQVTSYEPDPQHTSISKRVLDNLELASGSVRWEEKAVVPYGFGEVVEFVRVVGNTTSSHVAGSKEPYGELEKFSVGAVDILTALNDCDLVKMDVEGLEAELLLSLAEHSNRDKIPDMILEVGNQQNANKILDMAEKFGLHLFSQMNNWSEVENLSQMPKSYKDGSLFLTRSDEMPW